MRSRVLCSVAVLCVLSCGSAEEDTGIEQVIGAAGGELVGGEDTPFAGISLKIPPGALAANVTVRLEGTYDKVPLPDGAERVGVFVKLLPEGTTLAQPAELTVPLDGAMLSEFEGTPEVCKVWARSGDGWERLDALRNGVDTVTVPISRFTTAAAGVVFTNPKQACTATNPCTLLPITPQCEVLSNEYCITKLAKPQLTDYLDDWSSANVVDGKVYWVARPDAGGVTVYRYDLANPGPVFAYPVYTVAAVGPVSTRGRVAVVNEGEVWASVVGYGTLRFRTGADTQAFDRPSTGSSAQPVGVVASLNGSVHRFRRVVTPGSPLRFDVLMHQSISTTSKFVYTFERQRSFAGGVTIVADPEHVIGTTSGTDAFISSTARGPGHTFDPGSLVTGAGFWGVDFAEDPRVGRDADSPAESFTVATFHTGSPGEWAVNAAHGFTTQIDRWRDVNNNASRVLERADYPNPLRDLAFIGDLTMAISAGRLELYLLDRTNALTSVQLPSDEVGIAPFRVRQIPGTNDALLITRGPITNKGDFYRIKKR